jgi:glycerophosphoryl diester phosphodiesterase
MPDIYGPVKPRGGTAAERTAAMPVLAARELAVTTDGVLYVGDGARPGGVPVGTNTNTLESLTAATPFYVAHRGGGDEAAEHTLDAWERAANQGMTALEVSVQRTADGQLICLHDLTLDRTTTLTGNVTAVTWPDLQNNGSVDIGATMLGPAYKAQPVPSLRAVLDRFAATSILFLEPKDSSYSTVSAIFAVLDQYPTARVVWKFSTPAGGGLPGHAQRAKDRGYATWSYLAADSPQADINGAAEAADLIGIPASATTAQILAVVAAATAQGKKVMAWEVHRRYTRDRLVALGVSGIMCSGPTYVRGAAALATSTRWGTGLRAAGEVPHDDFATPATNLATVVAASREVVVPAANRSLLLGSLCPLANAAGTYTITFAMKWPTLPVGTNHADFIFAQQDDRTYQHQNAANGDGYHLAFRGSGLLQLYSHVNGSTSGTQLGTTVTTATPVADTWMTFSITVTPTQVTIQRTDDASAALTVDTAAHRGGYIHLASASSDTAVRYRDVVVS